MGNDYFHFKQFTINQDKCAFKVGTDGVILGAWADIKGKIKILDIGTGTGLIALMLAQRSGAEIVALEPDYDSFIQASENIKQSKWRSRIRIENKCLQDFACGNERFDLIVTNPPYFTNSLKNPDAVKSVARHDVTLTREDLLQGVSVLLKERGLFQLILPYTEGLMFIAEARDYGFFCNSILKVKPLPSSQIKRLVLGFSRKRLKPAEKFLTIEKGRRHDFTNEYINLTKEFYLKF